MATKEFVLSSELKQQLEEIKINPSENFVSGQSTTSFASSAIGAASSAVVMTGTAMQAASLSANIAAEGVKYVQNELMACLSENMVKIMTLPLDKVVAYTAAALKENTLNPGDAMTRLVKGSETVAKEMSESADKANEEAVKNGASEKVKKISYTVTKTLNSVKEGMDKITAYITSGPEWIEKQISNHAYSVLVQTSGKMNTITEDFEKIKNDWAYNVGKKLGSRQAELINQKVKDAQKKILDKVDQVKQQAKTIAKAAITAAVMKIKGLLGG